jgi:hypothetical protein
MSQYLDETEDGEIQAKIRELMEATGKKAYNCSWF